MKEVFPHTPFQELFKNVMDDPWSFEIRNCLKGSHMRMRKKKHGAERIAACAEYLITDKEPLSTLGSNQVAIFPAARPLHMEIGCGKGNFAVGMAAANPEYNFIAMERVSDVACCALDIVNCCSAKRGAFRLLSPLRRCRGRRQWQRRS